jgi:hypothetical protein
MNAQLKVSGSIVRGISLAIMAIVLVVSAGQPGGVASAQPVNVPSSQAVAYIYYDFCPGPDHTTTNIMIRDVADLYSADLKIPFDKNYLKIVSITTSTSIFAPGTVAPMDISAFNASGEISFIATLENPQEPISGTGTLFTINWEIGTCTTPGVPVLTIPVHVPVVPPNPPQLSDRNGMDIPYTAAEPCPSCQPDGCKVSGKVLLQGHTDSAGQRPDYGGTDIMLSTERDCPTNFTYSALWDWPGVLKAKTAADGSFTLPKAQTCKCLYAFKGGYLTALGQGPYPYTGTITMTDIILRGGDVTQDDAINIFDLTLIATHYGTEDVSTNPEAAPADINGDNKVNIYDLALAAGNSGVARGPQQWSR